MAESSLGGIGSVKAAINIYGQRATRSVSPQLDLPVVQSSLIAENLHKSEREHGYRESRQVSESGKTKAEAELCKAKKAVHELTLLIEESNQQFESRKIDTEAEKMSQVDDGSGRYTKIVRELEDVQQELHKLKVDIAYVSREKATAEKEVMELGFKMEENLKLLESLRLEVDVVNEEHVLVELAKIEALKECKEVEEQRERERKEVFETLDKRKKRIREMMREIERSKEKNELSETLSDIEMLETQLKLVKQMKKRVQRNDSMPRSGNRSFERGKASLSVLKEVTEATETKEELASINAELFCLVNTMDMLRQELDQVKQETARFEKFIQNDDAMIERLNKKLLITKDQLEAPSAAEERISSLADNITTSFEKLKDDKEAAKKEELNLKVEATLIKNEIQRTEIGFGENEKELLSKLDELEKAKQAEDLALEKLESMVETTMKTREKESQRNSTITISRFEYEYLSGQACHAEETAAKKVEAAMAWVEALKASTKAILIRTESLKRVSGKRMVEEERELFRMQRSLSIKRLVQDKIEKFKQNSGDKDFISPNPIRKSIKKLKENSEDNGLIKSSKPARKSVRLSGKFAPVMGGRSRRLSSGNRGTTTFFVIKKKVPNFINFFSRRRRKPSSEQ